MNEDLGALLIGVWLAMCAAVSLIALVGMACAWVWKKIFRGKK